MEIPKQRPSYPYAPLGYDIETMCKNFMGYGGDVVTTGGLRLTSEAQMQVIMNFLRVIQQYYPDWTTNELSAYAFVLSETCQGNLVGVKDVAASLGLPTSTASHVIQQLQRREYLDAYPCIEDKRRKWLRLHPKAIEIRMSQSGSIWEGQRQLLGRLLSEAEILATGS